MKTIRFTGGLGNQMFQYACYKALTNKYPDVKADINSYKFEHAHNGYELEAIFNVSTNKVSPFSAGIYDLKNRKWIYRKIRRILGLKRFYTEEEKPFTYDPFIFSNNKSAYYAGFWQNEEYFFDIAAEIRKDFKFSSLKDLKNTEILDNIQQGESIGVHIRRGDYVNHPSFGGICEKEYYQDAIRHMRSKITSPKFFIFSNDIDWCVKNLDISDAEFISWNNGRSSYIDMQLMSSCKHNIIANSSFSWWGAWLNNNHDKIVIGPKKWLNDPKYDTTTLLPKNWIRL